MSASKIIKYITVALLLPGWSVSSAQTCDGVDPNVTNPYVFEMPDFIGDLEFYDEQIHGDPRLGYVSMYIGDGSVLDISFYDYGFTDIPDGIDSEVLRKHYEEGKSLLKESAAYSKFTLQSERQVTLGPNEILALEAHDLLTDGQRKALYFIYLTAKYGEFIQVRLGLPLEKHAQTSKIVDAVFATLGKYLCSAMIPEQADSTTVLAAIDRMFGASTATDAMDEIVIVMAYAELESVPVQIVINENFFQFTDDMIDDAFFMAFYLAGAIKHDLKNPSASRDPGADALSAIRATIAALRIYQVDDPYYEHPFIEKLAKLDKAGELEAFVRSRR